MHNNDNLRARKAEIGTRAHIVDHYSGLYFANFTVAVTHWLENEDTGEVRPATFDLISGMEGRVIDISALHRLRPQLIESDDEREHRERLMREVMVRLPGDADVDLPKVLGLSKYGAPRSRSREHFGI